MAESVGKGFAKTLRISLSLRTRALSISLPCPLSPSILSSVGPSPPIYRRPLSYRPCLVSPSRLVSPSDGRRRAPVAVVVALQSQSSSASLPSSSESLPSPISRFSRRCRLRSLLSRVVAACRRRLRASRARFRRRRRPRCRHRPPSLSPPPLPDAACPRPRLLFFSFFYNFLFLTRINFAIFSNMELFCNLFLLQL